MHKSDNVLPEHTQQPSDIPSTHFDPVLNLVDRVLTIEIRQQPEEVFNRCGVFIAHHGGYVFVLPTRGTGGFDDEGFGKVLDGRDGGCEGLVRVRLERLRL